jgi:hypothetical protein
MAAVVLGVAAAAAATIAPASADDGNDAFLNALNRAGVHYGIRMPSRNWERRSARCWPSRWELRPGGLDRQRQECHLARDDGTVHHDRHPGVLPDDDHQMANGDFSGIGNLAGLGNFAGLPQIPGMSGVPGF